MATDRGVQQPNELAPAPGNTLPDMSHEPGEGANTFSEFVDLSPPWRALDKANYFLSEAKRLGVDDDARRRAAVFNLDAALVALDSFPDLVDSHFKRGKGRLRNEMRQDGMFNFLIEARHESVHRLEVRAPTSAHFTRSMSEPSGAGVDGEAELYFRNPKRQPEDPIEEWEKQLSITPALHIVEQQLDDLATRLREIQKEATAAKEQEGLEKTESE